MILVDSNVLIDVLGNDAVWRGWAIDHLTDLSSVDDLRVNAVILAEVAPRMGSLSIFYQQIAELDIEMDEISDEAAFVAGVAFQSYRRNKGGAPAVLPDFLIGGHAQSLNATILTRDPRFYRSYFPGVPLITPSKDD